VGQRRHGPVQQQHAGSSVRCQRGGNPERPAYAEEHQHGVELSTASSESGVHRFSSVAPGRYTLTAAADGFQATAVELTLLTAQTAAVNILLPVSTAAEQVTVTAEAPIVNTSGNTSSGDHRARATGGSPAQKQGRTRLGCTSGSLLRATKASR
jgi:hypothetical protein